MKRLLITVTLFALIGGMIAGCQVASRPWPMGKDNQSSEKAQDKVHDEQVASSADKHDSSISYDDERIYLYAGSKYDH